MGRRRKGEPIHGWLVIDKASGMTSSNVVNNARHILNAQKVGHGGTLDPMATGILPLAFGEATKTVSYIMDGTKEYSFTARWGESRDTDDAEGNVTGTSSHRPNETAICDVLSRFTGEIEQVPPAYSAVKVAGRRAYDLARAKEAVDLKARTILIESIELDDMPDKDHATFRVVSGKGAYMRGLARDIALAVGTLGHVSALRRTRLGPFKTDDAISLDKLSELGHIALIKDLLKPVATALDDIPALAMTKDEARRLKCGQAISALSVARRTPLTGLNQGDTIFAMTEGKPIALARFEGGEIRPFRVLNL